MNTFEINNALKENIEHIDCFIGTYPRDQLPKIIKKPAALIMNNDTFTEPGSHWVAIDFTDDDKGIYFDSFGSPPLFPNVIEYLNLNCDSGWIHSNTQLQAVTSQTCGHFCILFIIMTCNGYSLTDILRLFTQKSNLNELLIELYSK